MLETLVELSAVRKLLNLPELEKWLQNLHPERISFFEPTLAS